MQTSRFPYDDGSDVTREYNDFTVNGVGTTMVLDTAQLEMAKNDGCLLYTSRCV